MKAIEHLAQLLADMETEVACMDGVDDKITDCQKCKLTTPDRDCWLKWAKEREKEDGDVPDEIPCGYIRAKAYKATGAESTYLRKLLNDWEKENGED